jgi:hypothetical protein
MQYYYNIFISTVIICYKNTEQQCVMSKLTVQISQQVI